MVVLYHCCLFQSLNSGYIESHLMDIVRVVQPGRIYPVWVEKSTCIYIKVGEYLVVYCASGDRCLKV